MVRTHMNHGGNNNNERMEASPPPVGPRASLTLGFESARASQNVLRLLEGTYSVAACKDTLSTSWHAQGQVWKRSNDGDWIASAPKEEAILDLSSSSHTTIAPPALLDITFADDRTALAQLRGLDGLERYVSMIRIEFGTTRVANDGWVIVREVIGNNNNSNTSNESVTTTTTTIEAPPLTSISDLLRQYLAIEHGGGLDDRKMAEQTVFSKQASLVTVGIGSPTDPPSAWSAPANTFLEISLSTYLDSVQVQSRHSPASRIHDRICAVNVLECQSAAAAVVHVGNGRADTIFVDHLLLGRNETNHNEWKILSKVFAPRSWPA